MSRRERMDHIAILKKKWLEKILDKRKTIESRWYTTRRAPWNTIVQSDILYFKTTGELVTATATVGRVFQFMLSEKSPKDILLKYWKEIGIAKEEIVPWSKELQKKKYCILIELKNPKSIPAFNINKKGYGNMNAWICIDDVKRIIL